MTPGFILGILGGAAAAKWSTRRCGGGSCGGGGPSARSRRDGRLLWWISRELDLDPRQQGEVHELISKVRGALAPLRASRWQGVHAVVEAFGADKFDRARVEQTADQQGEALRSAKAELVAALARLHEILTPAQRARLQDLASRW